MQAMPRCAVRTWLALLSNSLRRPEGEEVLHAFPGTFDYILAEDVLTYLGTSRGRLAAVFAAHL